MANTRISDLTASASNLASTDLAPVVQTVGVGPVKMTGAQIAAGLLSATTPIGSGPILSRGGSATLQLGAADVASGAVAQTLQVQSNTGAATTGPNFTIKGSSGTTAGGSIIFQTAATTSYATALTIDSNGLVNIDRSTTTGGITFGQFGRLDAFGWYLQNSSGYIGWGPTGASINSDVRLYRDAANTLALKNSTNPQIFRAYSTTTGPSYGYFASGVTDAGVATADTLFIGTGGAGAAMTKLALVVNGTTRIDYNITNTNATTVTGNLYTPNSVTASFDILAGRYLYLGTVPYSGVYSAASGVIQMFSGAVPGDFNRLTFGGVTSSFPALKRSTTTLQVRLADDTGDAAFQCGTQTAGGTAFNVNGTGGNSIASVTNTTTGTLLQVLNSTSNPLMTVTDTTSGTLFSVQSTTAATLFSVNDTTSGTLLAVTNSSSTDVFTVSDAGQVVINGNANLFGEAANTLALRNGLNAQTFNVYNTYTDASNYERMTLRFSGAYAILQPQIAGTGTAKNVAFKESSGNVGVDARNGSGLYFYASGADNWFINTAGHFLAGTDNTYDIGAATTTRPRNLFIAGYEQLTEVTAPAAPAANSVRIYAEDNGSGKTRLMALFATGAAQQIAIEP